ncbi:hypothetical protein RI367_005070 [Sorochytrium milnesiophthora]
MAAIVYAVKFANTACTTDACLSASKSAANLQRRYDDFDQTYNSFWSTWMTVVVIIVVVKLVVCVGALFYYRSYKERKNAELLAFQQTNMANARVVQVPAPTMQAPGGVVHPTPVGQYYGQADPVIAAQAQMSPAEVTQMGM